MTKFWCVNLANDEGLSHGIEKKLWLMGYQYAHDQIDPPARKAAITRNWRRLKEINPGDRFVAYLPSNRFYAIGTVRTPRRPKTGRDRTDTIEAYLERGESYRNGFVYFTSSVAYENFTDECGTFPVRIDVEGWDSYVPDGVSVKGLDVIPRHELQMAAFEITKGYFDRILKKLTAEHETLPKRGIPGSVSTGVDEAVVEALEKSLATGQGFVLDSKLRKALEDYAMEAAKRHFKARGYKWEDRSKTCPYDLRCSRGKEVLYVEVKGTQTDGGEIILTPGEVEFARRHKGQMALFVLHSIQVVEGNDGYVLSGGERHLLQPWDVDLGNLVPVSFKYGLPTGSVV